jgi:hypothetical protein
MRLASASSSMISVSLSGTIEPSFYGNPGRPPLAGTTNPQRDE